MEDTQPLPRDPCYALQNSVSPDAVLFFARPHLPTPARKSLRPKTRIHHGERGDRALPTETQNTTPTQVDQQNTEVLSDGHFRLERIALRTETFTGEMSKPAKREVLRSGQSVAVLLFDPAADKLILTQQFRIGAHLNQFPQPWLIECVAGMVDEGESPEIAARREVEEETGCEVRQLEPIGKYLTSPGITDELAFLYVGLVDSSRAGGTHGKASEGEDIRTLILTTEEALAAADRGDILNIVAQLALLWFARNGHDLRERWLTAAPRP